MALAHAQTRFKPGGGPRAAGCPHAARWHGQPLASPVPSTHRRAACSAQDAQVPAATAVAASALPRRSLLLQVASAALLLQQWDHLEPAIAAQGITQVFVAGATGNTGRRVVQQLRAKGYLVRAGVRSVKKAQELGLGLDTGVTLVTADVTKGPKALAEAIGDSQAVISAIGAGGLSLVFGSGSVDEQGAINLVDAAKERGVQQFVMVSSLLTNAPAVGQADNPNYTFLNRFGQVLDHKHAAELYLRASGLKYTIVRPSGLSNDPADQVGNLIVGREDTLFGLDTDPGGRISRDTVAAVCVEALSQEAAANKVFEVEASPSAPALPVDQWFTV